MRPHLDYGNTVYDQVFNESFHKNLKSIQYNTAIAITGAIRGTSSGRLRIRLRILKIEKLVNKIKIILQNHEKSLYLFQLIAPNNITYATRSSQSNIISSFKTRHIFLKDSFFPAVISEWNSLDINKFFFHVFNKELLKLNRPEPNSSYNVNDTIGLKLLTRLQLGHSHVGDHKSRQNFQDCVSPMCY